MVKPSFFMGHPIDPIPGTVDSIPVPASKLK